MIQINKREFPNPVLASGRDDYLENCSYSFVVDADSIVVSQEFIEIPVSYELECESFDKLLRDKSAVSIVKVKSSSASYCRVYAFEQESRSMIIKIPKYDVVSSIELTGLIVTNKKLLRYSCNEMNPMYFSGMTFDFRKGDALALSNQRIIYIDDSELEKPIVSIFSIDRGHGQDEDLIVDFSDEDEKIHISLSERLNDMYWNLKDFNNGALRRYITAIIVSPALIEAIDVIKMHYAEACDEDYSGRRWFRAIELKAEKIGIDMSNCADSSVSVADRMLGNLSLDALKSFKDMLEQEMNSGETQMIGGVD